jgi:hypothetical protein
MRRSCWLLAFFLVCSSASFAQTGFSTQTYTVPNDSTLRSADFNGDGRPDLLLFGVEAGPYIMLNDGNGGFLAPAPLPGAVQFSDVQLGDMNGDGSPDIVGCLFAYQNMSSFLYIYLNDGSGHFTLAQTSPIAGDCTNVIVNDVNHDGHLDVIAASFSGVSPVNNIFTTFFGTGTGHVGTPVIQQNVDLDSTGAASNSVGCTASDTIGGDFYLDGNESLMVSSGCSGPPNAAAGPHGTVFLGHGNGTGQYDFTEITEGNAIYAAGESVDVNKDGKPDAVFVTGGYGNNPNYIFYGQNDGGGQFTFDFLVPQKSGNNVFQNAVVADFNGNGYNGFATSYSVPPVPSAPTPYLSYISILNGAPSNTFQGSQYWQVGGSGNSSSFVLTADFNADGKPDLAVLSQNTATAINTLYIYTNTMGTPAACSAPAQANTNILCQPAKGATVSSPVNVAAASNVSGLTLNRLYLDNVSVYQTTAASIDTQINAGNGPHTLVFVSYNNQGKAFTSSSNFTLGTACLPSAAGAIICQPTSNEFVGSPLNISAGATAASGNITAIRGYINNVPVFTVDNPTNSKSFFVNQQVNGVPNENHLVIVGYQSTGGSVNAAEDFYVTSASNCSPASAGAEFCFPAPNATVGAPEQISAGATAQTGYITALRLYVDSVSALTVYDPQQSKSFSINQPVALTVGKHNLVIVGYQSNGATFTASETITVD